MKRCPRCTAPQPHLHPAVQWEGEVSPCEHEYHATITPSNTAKRVETWRVWCADQQAHRRADQPEGE